MSAEVLTPGSVAEAADMLRSASAAGRTVRFSGGKTKYGWGSDAGQPDLELSTTALDEIVEFNERDLTAILQAGVPLARAQEAFFAGGEMLALDPPRGEQERATIGGVVATGDSGPLRHRYGAARDLVVGVTMVLADGTIAKSGGRVIKNVAGYDLGKLLAGSFGTLGLIAELVVRLHPKPPETVTVTGRSSDAKTFVAGAAELTRCQQQPECIDVSYRGGRGEVSMRLGGAGLEARAQTAADLLTRAGLEAVTIEDDDALWSELAGRQRGEGAVVVRVSGLQGDLPRVIELAESIGADFVGRAALGISWLLIPPADEGLLLGAIEEARARLSPRACVVLDAPEGLRRKVDVWASGDDSSVRVMRAVKHRFDPEGILAPGLFVGGI